MYLCRRKRFPPNFGTSNCQYIFIDMNEKQVIEERQKYVSAFNDTMIKIWKEQITLLGVIDSGALLRSPMSVGLSADGKFFQVKLSQAFLEYGLWQDYGTGAETPRENSGDIGRVKKRQRRRWFSGNTMLPS